MVSTDQLAWRSSMARRGSRDRWTGEDARWAGGRASAPRKRLVVSRVRPILRRPDRSRKEDVVEIAAAQREVRRVYLGGAVGSTVSAVVWLVSAALGTWLSHRSAIIALILGG